MKKRRQAVKSHKKVIKSLPRHTLKPRFFVDLAVKSKPFVLMMMTVFALLFLSTLFLLGGNNFVGQAYFSGEQQGYVPASYAELSMDFNPKGFVLNANITENEEASSVYIKLILPKPYANVQGAGITSELFSTPTGFYDLNWDSTNGVVEFVDGTLDNESFVKEKFAILKLTDLNNLPSPFKVEIVDAKIFKAPYGINLVQGNTEFVYYSGNSAECGIYNLDGCDTEEKCDNINAVWTGMECVYCGAGYICAKGSTCDNGICNDGQCAEDNLLSCTDESSCENVGGVWGNSCGPCFLDSDCASGEQCNSYDRCEAKSLPSSGGPGGVIVSRIPSSCAPEWECTQWSSCLGGMQTRVCNDVHLCFTDYDKPSLIQNCSVTDVVVKPVVKPVESQEPKFTYQQPAIVEKTSLVGNWGYIVGSLASLLALAGVVMLYLYHHHKKSNYTTDDLKDWVIQERTAGTDDSEIALIIKDHLNWKDDQIASFLTMVPKDLPKAS